MLKRNNFIITEMEVYEKVNVYYCLNIVIIMDVLSILFHVSLSKKQNNFLDNFAVQIFNGN